MNRRKVRFVGIQLEILEIIFNLEEGQEGIGIKKGIYNGEMESKKEVIIIRKWKDGEKNRF